MVHETRDQRHRRLTTQFIHEHLRPVVHGIKIGGEKQSYGEIMVITESLLFGVMQILTDIYGTSPAHASEAMDQCLHQAIKRLAALNKERNA
jgi:hypothetical protein